jgi:hypothetical protein
MRLCIREGAPESLVIDGIYGRSGKNSVWMDIYEEKNYEVFGRGLKNCMDVDLLGGMGYVGGDWKKVWMWMD